MNMGSQTSQTKPAFVRLPEREEPFLRGVSRKEDKDLEVRYIENPRPRPGSGLGEFKRLNNRSRKCPNPYIRRSEYQSPYFPQSPITEKLKEEIWFYNDITRQEADVMLKDTLTGTFLTRNSTTFPGYFAVSVKTVNDWNQSTVKHYVVQWCSQGYTIWFRHFFPSVADLITAHRDPKKHIHFQFQLHRPLIRTGELSKLGDKDRGFYF